MISVTFLSLMCLPVRICSECPALFVSCLQLNSFFSCLGSSQADDGCGYFLIHFPRLCSGYERIFKRKLTSFIIRFLSKIHWLQWDHMRAGMIDCVCPIIMLYTNYLYTNYLSITTTRPAHTSGFASGQTGPENPLSLCLQTSFR